jgi:hypothetical protein
VTYAIQEQGTDGLDVRQQTEDGEAVGETYQGYQEPTK